MISYYKMFWLRYTDFYGRSSRSEYWYVVLVGIILQMPYLAVSLSLFSTEYSDLSASVFTAFAIVYTLYGLAIIIPTLAIQVRRLHDVGKHWGYMFLPFIPIIGNIWLLILLITPSDAGNNAWGLEPEGSYDFTGPSTRYHDDGDYSEFE